MEPMENIVQSVAIRLVCERERERMAFRSATWFDVTATVSADETAFEATLDSVNGATLASGKNFDAAGALEAKAKVELLSEPVAHSIARQLEGRRLKVGSGITSTPRTQRPQPPFMTSSLQIEASRKLHFDPRAHDARRPTPVRTGLDHLYMSTDSTTLSDEAIRGTHAQAASMFGDDYVADSVRAARPQGARTRKRRTKRSAPPARAFAPWTRRRVNSTATSVRSMSWCGSARSPPRWSTPGLRPGTKVRLSGTLNAVESYEGPVTLELSATGLRIEFAGFRRAYVEGTDDPEAELADQERLLPMLKQGSDVHQREAKSHNTQPPDRYSEATLIKKLEDLGIGRPSTYASVMKTIEHHGYVWKKGKSLVPTFRAFAVVNLLEFYFADLVDYQFTAAMEDQLDEIAEGRQELEPWLRKFYFGDSSATSEFAQLGLQHVTHEPHDFDFAAINSLQLGVASDGQPVSVRSGRYGPYLVHGDERVSIPEATEPDSLTVEYALQRWPRPATTAPSATTMTAKPYI